MSKNGKQPSNGGGKESERRVYDLRRRRARRWAAFLALLAIPLPALILILGLRVGLAWVMVIVLVQLLVWWRLNRWAVDQVVAGSPPPGLVGYAPDLPGRRIFVGGLAAAGVFLLAPLCLPNEDLEARRDAAARWPAREQLLNDENARMRAIIDASLPPHVHDDPEVASLRDTLNQARKDLPRITDETICESDGRLPCSSGIEGRKERYDLKLSRQKELEQDIRVDLPEAISARIKAVEDNRAAAEASKVLAERRSSEIKNELSVPPGFFHWWLVINEIPRGWPIVIIGGVAVLAGLLHLLVDFWLLQLVARRICSVRNPKRSADGDAATGVIGASAPGSVSGSVNGSPAQGQESPPTTPNFPGNAGTPKRGGSS